MLPKKLIIQGLYSYKTKQVIHFDSLTAHHLFGIFGPVGSGKSSILDAITFALYNEIDRLNKNDNRSKNLFNQESDEFLIDFEFEAGADNQAYRFVVNNHRNKKGEPKLFDRQSYIWESNTWKPLGKMTAESIFNLSYENFKRAIIIPQGKFQEFFSLSGGERTNMMMDLFPRLSEFDLFDKVATKLTETKLELADLQGQLKQLGDLDPLEIEICKNQIIGLENEIEKTEKEVLTWTGKLQEIKDFKFWQNEYDLAQTSLLNLEPKELEMSKKKQQLEEFEYVFNAFGTPFQLLEKSRTDVDQLKLRLSVAKKELATQLATFEEKQRNLEKAEHNKIAITNLENQLLEWEQVWKILDLEKEKNLKILEFKNLEEKIQHSQDEKENNLRQIEKLEKGIQSLEMQLPDISKMLQAENLLKEKYRLHSELDILKQTLQNNEQTIEEWRIKKEQVLSKKIQAKFQGLHSEMKIKELLDVVAKIKTDLAEEIKVLHQEKEEIMAQDHLFTYASQIKEGLPCPLCGSTHHPHVITAADVSLLKSENEAQIKEKSDFLTQLSPLEGHLIQIQTEVKNLLKEMENLKQTIGQKKSELEKIENQSIDNEWILQGLESIQSNLVREKNIQVELKNSRQQAKKWSDSLKEEEAKLNLLEKEKSLLENANSSLDGKIMAHREHINTLTDWENMPQLEAEKRIKELGQIIKELKAGLDLAEREMDGAKNNLITIQTTAREQEEQLDALKKDLSLQEEKFRQLLTFNQMDEESVKRRLAEIWETNIIRNQLETFFQEIGLVRQKLADAQTKIGKKILEENEESITIENLKIAQQHLANQQIELGTKNAEWKRLSENFRMGMEIKQKENKATLRKENLSILHKLFSNKGFVNFASSRYLNNIVEMANERFFKMTKQRLRLTMDDQNNFLVKDYLNNGHERLAKTLSGGQTFQASLCLALALADSIGHITQSTRNFFFLDEGFGSLDKEALSMVFDTLRQLQNENRIVGVISHVEELQQEMPAYLQIKLTAEQGSIIELGG